MYENCHVIKHVIIIFYFSAKIVVPDNFCIVKQYFSGATILAQTQKISSSKASSESVVPRQFSIVKQYFSGATDPERALQLWSTRSSASVVPKNRCREAAAAVEVCQWNEEEAQEEVRKPAKKRPKRRCASLQTPVQMHQPKAG